MGVRRRCAQVNAQVTTDVSAESPSAAPLPVAGGTPYVLVAGRPLQDTSPAGLRAAVAAAR